MDKVVIGDGRVECSQACTVGRSLIRRALLWVSPLLLQSEVIDVYQGMLDCTHLAVQDLFVREFFSHDLHKAVVY